MPKYLFSLVNKLGAAIFCISLILFNSQLSQATASAIPSLVSFVISPNSVDIATPNTLVNFDLTVNNSSGIASVQTLATLTNGIGAATTLRLVRTDYPVDYSLQTVKFHGALVIPTSMPSGVYTASASPITGLNSDGSLGFPTSTLSGLTSSTLKGAEGGLQIRNAGNLNYSYPTFSGPAFNKSLISTFIDPKYAAAPDPIWKVGETFNVNTYYEPTIPTIPLKLRVNTPIVCTSSGSILTLVSTGGCSFTVYTDKTVDYQSYRDDEVITVASARIKPTYSVGTIPTQSSTSLPLSIAGPTIFSPLGLVLPVAATPSICFPVGSYITVISGGTCTVNYSTPATPLFLASDIFPLTFQITRTVQTLSFNPLATTSLVGKAMPLSASASSGLPVTFQSDSPSICTTSGNSLNFVGAGSCLVEAVQSGSATIAPASLAQTILVSSSPAPSKKIICVKAGKSKVFVGTKCPAGYKVKK